MKNVTEQQLTNILNAVAQFNKAGEELSADLISEITPIRYVVVTPSGNFGFPTLESDERYDNAEDYYNSFDRELAENSSLKIIDLYNVSYSRETPFFETAF